MNRYGGAARFVLEYCARVSGEGLGSADTVRKPQCKVNLLVNLFVKFGDVRVYDLPDTLSNVCTKFLSL